MSDESLQPGYGDNDFIEQFLAATEHEISPEIFRKWAAICTVACALERKTWLTTTKILYPNLFVFLVAPPAVGKAVLGWSRACVQGLKGTGGEKTHYVASLDLSRASFADELSEARRDLVIPGMKGEDPTSQFYSLSILHEELGVLFSAYEQDFMSVLTHVYDCREFSEKKRHGTKIQLDHVQANICGAVQPAYLKEVIPEIAWEQGFMSRVIMVYSADKIKKPLFADQPKTRLKHLVKRLTPISRLYGEFKFTPNAAELLIRNYEADWPPEPEHYRLQYYNGRRTVHILKLAMVASASENDKLAIHKRHIQRAMDWLYEAEDVMPEIFKSMASSGSQGDILRDTLDWARTKFILDDGPIPEHEVVAFLSERMEAVRVQATLNVMVASRLLIPAGTKGKTRYKPRGIQV